ncbi:hypothetical protein D6B98_36955 [Bradyrhizobium sp. LVM 105]|nr:hypothetical protein D6B98_36955 [Bradyrhizobium sp. LVM 105]
MIAAKIDEVSRETRAEEAARKRGWIASARMAFQPRRREACFVCGKFQSISQAHHVVPLGEQFDRGFSVANHEHEFLCPNHHAILNLWIDDDISHQRRGRRAAPTFEDLTNEEVERMFQLSGRAGPVNATAKGTE